MLNASSHVDWGGVISATHYTSLHHGSPSFVIEWRNARRLLHPVRRIEFKKRISDYCRRFDAVLVWLFGVLVVVVAEFAVVALDEGGMTASK